MRNEPLPEQDGSDEEEEDNAPAEGPETGRALRQHIADTYFG